MSHTQGKLIVKGGYSIYAEDGKMQIADACVTASKQTNDEANARRLVAAWNFCEGIETEVMELAVSMGTNSEQLAKEAIHGRRSAESERDALRAVNAELVEALEDAATSLETINRMAGKASYGIDEYGPIPTYMGHHDEVRGYAGSRAVVARAALAKAKELKGTE